MKRNDDYSWRVNFAAKAGKLGNFSKTKTKNAEPNQQAQPIKRLGNPASWVSLTQWTLLQHTRDTVHSCSYDSLSEQPGSGSSSSVNHKACQCDKDSVTDIHSGILGSQEEHWKSTCRKAVGSRN